MLEIIKGPWHWSVAGALIGLTVPALLVLGNKSFGLSSSLRHICAACLPTKLSFFQYDWKKESWNLFFVGGIFLGGLLTQQFLQNTQFLLLNQQTVLDLQALGVQDFGHLMPTDLFGAEQIFTRKGLIFLVLGGFLLGFGTRYANGCTSGHAIMGLSILNWPSLVATICFMLGGFLMTHLGLPFLLRWVQ
jgi:uncharacterized protein